MPGRSFTAREPIYGWVTIPVDGDVAGHSSLRRWRWGGGWLAADAAVTLVSTSSPGMRRLLKDRPPRRLQRSGPRLAIRSAELYIPPERPGSRRQSLPPPTRGTR